MSTELPPPENSQDISSSNSSGCDGYPGVSHKRADRGILKHLGGPWGWGWKFIGNFHQISTPPGNFHQTSTPPLEVWWKFPRGGGSFHCVYHRTGVFYCKTQGFMSFQGGGSLVEVLRGGWKFGGSFQGGGNLVEISNKLPPPVRGTKEIPFNFRLLLTIARECLPNSNIDNRFVPTLHAT